MLTGSKAFQVIFKDEKKIQIVQKVLKDLIGFVGFQRILTILKDLILYFVPRR